MVCVLVCKMDGTLRVTVVLHVRFYSRATILVRTSCNKNGALKITFYLVHVDCGRDEFSGTKGLIL